MLLSTRVVKRVRRGGRRARGFTLIEVAIVVAIIGILAAICTVVFIRYRRASRTAEAHNVVGLIKAEQEHYRAEKGIYAAVSADAASFYPAASPGSFATEWGGACTNCAGGDVHAWEKLPGIKPGAPVMYGYATVAGVGGTQVGPTKGPLTLSAAQSNAVTELGNEIKPTEPFYMISAQGDTDGDGVATTVLALSKSNLLIVTNEGE